MLFLYARKVEELASRKIDGYLNVKDERLSKLLQPTVMEELHLVFKCVC